MCTVLFLFCSGDVETWWLTSTVTPLPSHSEEHMPLQYLTVGLQPDTLHVPGSIGSSAGNSEDGRQSSAASSELDLLLKLPTLSRTRSNSVKSYTSSSKSAQVFQRAGSFRHKIKCDSLSAQQISDSDVSICKKTSTGAVTPNFLTVSEETSRLLGTTGGMMKKLSVPNMSTKIVIQVDEAD